jgi:uncharacterized membrane protein
MGPRGEPLAARRLLVVAAFCPLLIHLAVADGAWTRLAAGSEWFHVVDLGLIAASGLPHTLIYLGLLAMFGATLRPGHDALVTTLARRMYGDIPDDMARYTRRVTWAWCFFFAAQLLTSLTLFLLAPLAAWSFFVNILNVPLVVLMFVAEQLCRPFLLRDAPRHSFADVRRMIRHITSGLSRTRSN